MSEDKKDINEKILFEVLPAIMVIGALMILGLASVLFL